MDAQSTQSVKGSYPASNTAASSHHDAAEQSLLQQQRLDAFKSEPWESGNRLVALPYRNPPTEASRLSQGPPPAKLPQGLRGVGSWADSSGRN
ncbi:hypothetical protein VPNG_07199 [Cytospora leucostoma]|uniref:Uncharacterized protein n=1 Tax=Cytospora leucostoma TaxID=1230097 RepID=A0A423WJR0_9PEZI|nr:hypothetical protein VPNG_07199 [Cytospora leucostoma]